jgi:hypothetical protein
MNPLAPPGEKGFCKRLRRDEALEILRRLKPSLVERYGISGIGIFGSVARDEAGPESDVDVVVRLDSGSLGTLVRIHEELEEAFGTRVDLVRYRDSLRPLFKRRLDQDCAYV